MQHGSSGFIPVRLEQEGKRPESELAVVAEWILSHIERQAPQFGGFLGASVKGHALFMEGANMLRQFVFFSFFLTSTQPTVSSTCLTFLTTPLFLILFGIETMGLGGAW